jgi:hypothetical protein
MNRMQMILIDEFKDSSRSDMLSTLFDYELEMRTATSKEQRESLEHLLYFLWPEYLST